MQLELLTTPSFQNDSWQVPKSTQKKLFHALKQIQNDPYTGNGHAKKCFKQQYSNVYRYRIGNYRLIYCVGNKCIKLLMAGKRADIYQRFASIPDANVNTPVRFSGVDPKPILTTHFDPPQIVDSFSGEDMHVDKNEDDQTNRTEEGTRLLAELLEEWGVPDEDIELISSCSCIEDIFDLDIDDGVKERVLRWNQPAKIEEVIEEPVYDLPSVEHLEKYMAGTLKGFLLKLDPDQEKVAKKNLKGPTLVKGGPGTGKSLVALYRIRNLMQPDAQRDLFNETPPKILFVTYTTTLIRASEQLLNPLLGDSMEHVHVNNLDKIVRMIIGQAGLEFRPATEHHKSEALTDAIQLIQNGKTELPALKRLLDRVSNDYMIAEFDWVIEGREINSLEDYLQEDRTGRGIPFDVETRKAVWELHERYCKKLLKNERETWDQLRTHALKALLNGNVSMPKYDVVIVDEAQDLTPVGIRLCVALCKNPQGFYMTADSGQSIYNRGFSWKRIDSTINIRGRTTILKYNYRSTRQIMEAAIQPLRENGGADPETVNLIPVLDGPKPTLKGCAGVEEQVEMTIQFLKKSAEELRLPVTAGAVFIRSNKAGEEFANCLSERGIPAELVKGNTFDLDKKIVKVMTLHSAKGLEFPFVAVVRVDSNQIPMMIWKIKDPDEKTARLADERRLLSVGLSRAMRRLALFYDKNRPSHFIREIDSSLWK